MLGTTTGWRSAIYKYSRDELRGDYDAYGRGSVQDSVCASNFMCALWMRMDGGLESGR